MTDLKRRSFLIGAGACAAAGLGVPAWRRMDESGTRAKVFVAKAASYEIDLVRPIRDGLLALGLGPRWAGNKSVLLKPNLVEPSREAPQINTHPRVVLAAAEVFRSWGAREVIVAEGQGHCVDSDYVLEQSGLGAVLSHEKLGFLDLNHDDVWTVANRARFTSMSSLTLPMALRRADIIVSMPKLKTHHWAGVTLSLKNLFGIMPGTCYGWPKNELHWRGIDNSIVDIALTRTPDLAIVDGIIGMEGDGPLNGTAKPMGVLVMGSDPLAVDATCCRLMMLDPEQIGYLVLGANKRLGLLKAAEIRQVGEAIEALALPFETVPHFNGIRMGVMQRTA
jgi:uncharacterized protein (DUF362 family)